MDNPGQETALDRLRAAVRAAGGQSAVARRARMPISHLGNILIGRRQLARETASKLRPHVELDAQTWLDLLAPAPPTEQRA